MTAKLKETVDINIILNTLFQRGEIYKSTVMHFCDIKLHCTLLQFEDENHVKQRYAEEAGGTQHLIMSDIVKGLFTSVFSLVKMDIWRLCLNFIWSIMTSYLNTGGLPDIVGPLGKKPQMKTHFWQNRTIDGLQHRHIFSIYKLLDLVICSLQKKPQLLNHRIFFFIITGKRTGSANNINNSSVLFKCPIKPWQCGSEPA